MSRFRSLLLVAAVSLLAVAQTAVAQTWPSKPIRLVSPWPPGSSVDILARLLAPPMAEALGQNVIVENRPGAGGNIGVEAVARAPADGYTIGIGARGPLAINGFLMDRMPYDPMTDLAPVAMFASSAIVLLVNASHPARTLQEFIAMARANPGKYNYASTGIGSTNHLGGEVLRTAAGVDLVHVPYKGTQEALTGLLTDDVQLLPAGLPPLLGQLKAGKIRALAVADRNRIALIPDVPTVAEVGVPGAEMTAWFGMVAPAGTPPEVIAKLRDALGKTLARPEIKSKLVSDGLDPVLSTPQEFAALMRTERDTWGAVIRKSNIKAQ